MPRHRPGQQLRAALSDPGRLAVLKGLDLILVAERERDVVEAVQDAVAPELVKREAELKASCGDGLLLQINGYPDALVRPDEPEELVNLITQTRPLLSELL